MIFLPVHRPRRVYVHTEYVLVAITLSAEKLRWKLAWVLVGLLVCQTNTPVQIFIAISGLVFMIFAAMKNSRDEVGKLKIMESDMDLILGVGGVVAMRSQNYKYGSAYLYVGIDAKTWSTELMSKYTQELRDVGWVEVDSDGESILCKQGISAEVNGDVEYGDGVGMYGIAMTYNALTIKKCSIRQSR